MNSGPRPPATAGIREYARRHSVTPKAIRKAVDEGRIVTDADGRILVAESDARLAQGAVHGRRVSHSLAEARRRKMAAAVRLLDDEVALLRGNSHERGECRLTWQTLCAEAATELVKLLDLVPELAGMRPVMAAERLRERLYEILDDLAGRTTVDLPIRPEADDEEKAPTLADMSAVELATLRADLQAESLELRRRLRQGELLNGDEVDTVIRDRIYVSRSRLLGLPNACGGWFELGPEEGSKRLREDLADCLAELAALGVEPADFLPPVLLTAASARRRDADDTP